MCHFREQNGPFVLNKFFLAQTIIITFIYLLAPFIVQNLQKILTADPKLWGCPNFWVQNGLFAPNYHFHLTISPFHFAKFKKILPRYPELWGCAIFGHKMAHLPKWEFLQKTCLWTLFLSFMPIYMPKIKVRY